MVSQKEIIVALRFGNEIALTRIADEIESEGIAPPVGECPMNNDLLKRIDAALYDDANPYQVLRDCRAEIERIVKCAETATDGDTGDTIYIGEAYPEDDVKAILDKYRGQK